MSNGSDNVVVIPCSGIGKPAGSVAREAAYELCERLCPHDTTLLALSKLVLGDSGARESVQRSPVVTIDGCPRMCAATMVKQSGGVVVREMTVLDVYRAHKDLKPEGVAELNEAGRQLACLLAGELAEALPGIKAASCATENSHA